MTNTTETLKQTPLYNQHCALGARMVGFGGWNMPVQYEGILAEYEATRKGAALFDISHMGEFIVEGDYSKSGLDKIVTMSLKDLPARSCRYGAMLNERGGVIDDLIVFRLEEEKWFIVVNGATTEKDAKHIQANLTPKARFTDVSMQTGKLDLQGPQSRKILNELVEGVEKLDYYTFDYFDLLDEHVLISRTGYTGELGYEIYYPWDKTARLWDELLKNDAVKPAGLGARDVLRLEMGYSLYGHELNEETTPLESGLTRFIDFDKEFIGKNVLLGQKEKGLAKRVAAFESLSRRSPREGHTIYDESGEPIGAVTSGTFSPCKNTGIGLGFVKPEFTKRDTLVFFGNDKSKTEAKISSRIFYQHGSLKT